MHAKRIKGRKPHTHFRQLAYIYSERLRTLRIRKDLRNSHQNVILAGGLASDFTMGT